MLRLIFLIVSGGLIFANWEKIKVQFQEFLVEAVNFTALKPTNFKLKGNRLQFDFNFQFENPSPVPARVQEVDIKVFKLNNDLKEYELLGENTAQDKIRPMILDPGLNQKAIQFDIPVGRTLESVYDTFSDFLIAGNQQLFRIEASLKILDEMEPITTTIDFAPFSQLNGLSGNGNFFGNLDDFLSDVGTVFNSASDIVNTGSDIADRGRQAFDSVTGQNRNQRVPGFFTNDLPGSASQQANVSKLLLLGGGVAFGVWMLKTFLSNNKGSNSIQPQVVTSV